MKFNYSRSVLFIILSCIPYGCKDLFEDSISKKVVTIVTPSDGTVSTSFSQTFWWENLEDALHYRLRIVYNKLDSSAQFRLDTLLTKNKFIITLKPAHYQWWVEASNGSSTTGSYTVQNLTIDNASVVGQDIVLTSPSNGVISNASSINFAWQPLPGATAYQLKLYTDNNALILDSLIQGTPVANYPLSADGAYHWTITGKRNEELSNTSEPWNFVMDRIAPDSVTLNSPISGATPTNPVTLSWTAPEDNQLSHYEIYVYKDSPTTPFSNKYNPYSTATNASPLKTSFVFSEGSLNDKIVWKVRVVDKAGNKSDNEKTRTFIIH